jgi:nucleoside-diphosphate-sugar epimerase
MRVLITGTEGYIGSLMAPLVVAHGHDVTGLDTGYFRNARLEPDPPAAFRVIDKDLRRVTRQDLEGFDAVIHLAGLSNDALGQIYRPVTYDVNHRGSIRLAALAKAAGVTRFLYSSSCSVYGRSADAIVTEESKVDPQTDYALCKMLDEWELTDLADDTFSPTFLRNATAYGASPRMRFDLVVNNLSGLAWTARRIAMLSDGSPWRPLVNVRDIVAAFLAVLHAPRETVHNQVFNVGATEENYQIREIASCVSAVFPGCEISFGTEDSDQRSYRVCFDKIQRVLPGFKCQWTLRQGTEQLRELFERVSLDQDTFQARGFTRLNQLRHLIDTGQVDANFFWTGR